MESDNDSVVDLEMSHVTSMFVYRVYISTPLTAGEFIFRTANCTAESGTDWRCTKYDEAYTMNMLVANDRKFADHALTCLFFTKKSDMDWLRDVCQELFDARPELEHISLINWVEKFYTPFKMVMLEDLYGDLDGLEVDGEPVSLSMNLQKFCALQIRPFGRRHKLTISTFSNGKLNVTGITSRALFDRLLHFILNTLYPLLSKHDLI